MDKKAFTLVELLSVIVILTIILVIAVPKVMEIITSAVNYYLREDAFVSYLRGEVFGNLFTGYADKL